MKVKGLFIVGIAGLSLCGCKKENSASPPPTTATLLIAGKWNQNVTTVRTYNSAGTKLDSTTTTGYTSNDFVIYYADGTGYYSEYVGSGISLNEFNYTISGASITEYITTEAAGLNETITNISSHSFSLHVVQLIADANNPDATDTQISDFNYIR